MKDPKPRLTVQADVQSNHGPERKFKLRILVADDSGVSRHVICAFLREWGHDVVSAKNGTEALEALRSDTGISLALVDWMMPGLDGIEVCRQLRAIPDRAYTYMISVTSRNEKQDLVCALEAGFDDFLTKPVQPAELNARLLVGRQNHRPSGEAHTNL